MIDSILNKYAAKPTDDTASVEGEGELVQNQGSFGWLRGMRDRAVMLELRKKDGNITAVGYAWLERVDYDPSVGITLHMVGKTIVIKGRHLNGNLRSSARLFEGITRHRVPWVQEADGPQTMQANEDATIVERIQW